MKQPLSQKCVYNFKNSVPLGMIKIFAVFWDLLLNFMIDNFVEYFDLQRSYLKGILIIFKKNGHKKDLPTEIFFIYLSVILLKTQYAYNPRIPRNLNSKTFRSVEEGGTCPLVLSIQHADIRVFFFSTVSAEFFRNYFLCRTV